jgi:hypothetical protein
MFPAFHPRLNDKGERVIISHPTAPTLLSAFGDPERYAMMLVNGQAPQSVNGIAFEWCQDVPKSVTEWIHVEGQCKLEETRFSFHSHSQTLIY